MSELKMIADKLDSQDTRLGNIEAAIGKIAVQDEKILNVQVQINALWKKYDDALGPEGTVSKIRNHQAGCPENRVTNLENRFWGVLVSIGLIYLSGIGGVLFFALRTP